MQIGIDLGGTKIAGVVVDAEGCEHARLRKPTPQGDYDATCETIAALVRQLELTTGCQGLPVGVGTPGTFDPDLQTLRGCNSTCLNGRPFVADLEAKLDRRVAIANDANCLVLSESFDGAASSANVVFGVILGTGVGGGLVVDKKILAGRHGIAGEWGHTPLPGRQRDTQCWCGKWDCIEAHLCGPALASRSSLPTAKDLAADVRRGVPQALDVYQAWLSDLARALATVLNIVDPDVVVFGGGLSQMPDLYQRLPPLVAKYLFAPTLRTEMRPAKFGDDSGVRGAARLPQP